MDYWMAVRLVIVDFNLFHPFGFWIEGQRGEFWTENHHQFILLKRTNFGFKQIFMISLILAFDLI